MNYQLATSDGSQLQFYSLAASVAAAEAPVVSCTTHPYRDSLKS